jgi:hypothetical protein
MKSTTDLVRSDDLSVGCPTCHRERGLSCVEKLGSTTTLLRPSHEARVLLAEAKDVVARYRSSRDLEYPIAMALALFSCTHPEREEMPVYQGSPEHSVAYLVCSVCGAHRQTVGGTWKRLPIVESLPESFKAWASEVK